MVVKLTTEQKSYLKRNMEMTMSGKTKMYAIKTSGYCENILDISSMLDSIIFTTNQIAMDYEGTEKNHLTDIMYGISATARQCKRLLPCDIAEFMDKLTDSTLEAE